MLLQEAILLPQLFLQQRQSFQMCGRTKDTQQLPLGREGSAAGKQSLMAESPTVPGTLDKEQQDSYLWFLLATHADSR